MKRWFSGSAMACSIAPAFAWIVSSKAVLFATAARRAGASLLGRAFEQAVSTRSIVAVERHAAQLVA
jgi:hypothetical protein